MTADEPDARTVSFASMPMSAWLELFYDLIFVAAILVFSSAVSHLHDAGRIVWVVGVFVVLWWIWVSTTMYFNRYGVADVVERFLVLAQMFFVVVLAVEALEGVKRDSVYLSITFALLIGTVGAMYWRSGRSNEPLAAFARSRARYAFIAGVFFLVAAAFDDPVRGILWSIGLAATVIPTIVQTEKLGPTAAINESHALERFGAFTIIVCGEAFLKVAIAISNAEIVRLDLVALAFQFVLTFAIWSTYFEDFPNAGIGRGKYEAWASMHLIVQLGIAATAIGVAQLVTVAPFADAPDSATLEVTISLMVIYLGLAQLGRTTRRRPQGPLLALRLGTVAVVALVGGLAWAIPDVDLVTGLGALAIVTVGHAYVASRLRKQTEVLVA